MYLEHMVVKFEQNLMVRNIQNFELFDKNPVLKTLLKKRSRHFRDVSVAETIIAGHFNNSFEDYHLSALGKKYSCPTLVTKLKVAPSMAGPISFKHADSSLKQ